MTIDFEALLPQLRALCAKYDVVELSVFGSVARGTDDPDSDVDLLYVLKPDSEIGLEFFGFCEELEQLLGRPVDVVSKKGLNWIVRERVLDDAKVLHAA